MQLQSISSLDVVSATWLQSRDDICRSHAYMAHHQAGIRCGSLAWTDRTHHTPALTTLNASRYEQPITSEIASAREGPRL